MNPTQDFNFPEFFWSLNRIQKEAYEQGLKKSNPAVFNLGQKDILEKLLVIIKQWERGLYSDEEFKKIIKDYYNDLLQR